MSLQQHLRLNVAGLYLWKILMTYVERVRRTYATFPDSDDENKLVFYRGLRLALTMH